MKHLYIVFLVFLAALLTAGCSENETMYDDTSDGGLVVEVYAPRIAQLRGVDDGDGYHIPEDVVEQINDGWAMKNLTVIVCDMNDKLVAWRTMALSTSSFFCDKPAVYVAFDFNNSNIYNCANCKDSKGSLIYTDANHITGANKQNFRAGKYKIYAVANYKDGTRKPDYSYETTDAIYSAINTITEEDYRGNLKYKDKVKDAFKDIHIETSGTDNVCDRNDYMVLTQEQEVNVKSGTDVIKIQLLRTRSRIRVEILNQSTEYLLEVKDFHIGEATTKSIPLFPTNELKTSDAVPNVTSDINVQPFSQGMKISKGGRSTCIFDGYVLENANTKGFKLDFGIRAFAELKTETAQDAMNTPNGLYMIKIIPTYGSEKNEFITGWEKLEDGTIRLGNFYDIKDVDINDIDIENEKNMNYLWEFEDGKYLKSMQDNFYIQHDKQGNNYQVLLGRKRMEIHCDNKQIHYYDYNRGELYVTHLCQWKNNTSSSTVEFYPVSGTTFIEKNGIVIPFKKIVNNLPEDIKDIHRNDFLHVLINVRYNQKLGDFEIEVKDWHFIDNEVPPFE